MSGTRYVCITALVLSGAVGVASCGGDESDANGAPAPDATADGGRDANIHPDAQADAGEQDSATGSCTPTPGDDLPDEAFADTNCDGVDGDASSAVFVSTSGSDGAAGSRAAPVRTISKAIALAAAQGKAVYVCNGTYEENVQLLAETVSLYGGYDCSRDVFRSSTLPYAGTRGQGP